MNLDTWAMRPQTHRRAHCPELAECRASSLVEGVMGLFDGAPERGQCGTGSTADLAALTGWPVILVLDVTAQAETAAAIALGCKTYRDDIAIAGVILNRVGSEGHLRVIAQAMARRGIPVLGAFKRDGDAGAAGTPPRSRAGLRDRRSRGFARSPRQDGRSTGADFRDCRRCASRAARRRRPFSAVAAAGATDRARPGSRLLVRLPPHLSPAGVTRARRSSRSRRSLMKLRIRRAMRSGCPADTQSCMHRR